MSILTVKDISVIAFGILVILFWFFLYFKGKSHEKLFLNLDDTDYPLHELYFVGYAFERMTKQNHRTKGDRELRKQIVLLYDEKYLEYYHMVVYACRYTMAFTILTFAMPVYCLTQSMFLFLFVIVFAGVAFYYYGTVLKEKLNKRNEELLNDFSEVVSKLALLTNAGMILHEAWEKTAYSGKGVIYEEMVRSVIDMQNGVAEPDALFRFGQHCMVPEIRKFASTLIQGMNRGNAELSALLVTQSKEVWLQRQNALRKKGELANSQLLVPMFLTFIGILIMVIVPIFSGIGA